MRFQAKFMWRQILRSGRLAAVLVVCVMLSIVSLTALNGFSRSVERGMQAEARELHAGDIIVRSRLPLTSRLEAALAGLAQNRGVQSTRVYEFYSVIRSAAGDASLLCRIKAVDRGYPLYGSVELQTQRPLDEALTAGQAAVERGLLDRLGLRVGDTIQVGSLAMTIADVVLSEPDRSVEFFSFGPRVLVSTRDLEAIDLLEKGSRASYKVLLKLPAGKDLDKALTTLRTAAGAGEQVDSFRTAGSRAKRFFDNFLLFLGLVGTFTLLLAGIGIQNALGAFLKEKENTIAVMKTLGATSGFITTHFLLILSCLGAAGTVAGMGAAALLQQYLPVLFSGLLPPGLSYPLSWRALAEGAALGVPVVALFSFRPLRRLKEIRPVAVFRNEPAKRQTDGVTLLTSSAVGLFFGAMVLARIEDLRIGLYVIAGTAVLLAAAGAAVRLVFKLLARLRIRRLPLRQAMKGLFRPRNATAAIVITLAASLTVVFSIRLIEKNLDAAYVQSFPPDTPNVFFLDIQPSQQSAFAEVIATPAVYYPIVRARIAAVNGDPIDRRQERARRGDNLARTFNLTYRENLLADEVVVSGGTLFKAGSDALQVSVLDTVTDMHPLAVGDRITFDIQGVPLTAAVSSIRSRTSEGLRPFFYFVFPEKALEGAPRTIFTALRLPPEEIAPLQNRVVARFPNVSVIDVTQAVSVLSRLVAELARIVQFFGAFSVLAGLLIVVSSIFATRIARTREAVYYKILGARSRFVLTVFTLENALLGGISAALAFGMAQTVAWLTATRLLNVVYRPFWTDSIGAAAAAVLLVTVIGLLPSLPILRHRPALYLNSQPQ